MISVSDESNFRSIFNNGTRVMVLTLDLTKASYLCDLLHCS